MDSRNRKSSTWADSATVIERVPPHSIEAEQAVLASMLTDREAIAAVREAGVMPADFYRQSHAAICTAIYRLDQAGKPVDLVTMSDQLGESGALEEAGGFAYLVDLTGSVPTTAWARNYAEMVKEKAAHRAAIRHHSSAIAAHYSAEEEPQAIEDAFTEAQAGIITAKGDEYASDAAELADLFWADLEERIKMAASGQRNLLELGFYDVDAHLGGLAPGDLGILGGRPAMGKTAMALAFFWNVASYGRPHLYTLEMSRVQMMQRLACMLAGVDVKRLRSGDIRPSDREALEAAMVELATRDFVINETPGLTLEQLRRSVMKDVAAGRGPKLVMVDYLQLMTATKGENRNLELSIISRGLKNLAREAGCVVIALSQLSRGIESRTDKRPLMSDLRESGSLEQDADLVAFVYRDEYYNPDTDKRGVVELIFGKWRHGAVGTVELYFDRQRQKFSDIGAGPGSYAHHAGMPTYEDAPRDEWQGGGYAPIL